LIPSPLPRKAQAKRDNKSIIAGISNDKILTTA
jgi:hypothetical protein